MERSKICTTVHTLVLPMSVIFGGLHDSIEVFLTRDISDFILSGPELTERTEVDRNKRNVLIEVDEAREVGC